MFMLFLKTSYCVPGGDEQAAEICALSEATAAEAAAVAMATAASADALQPSDSDEVMEDTHGGECDSYTEEEDAGMGGGPASSAVSGGWCSSADGTPASATAGLASSGRGGGGGGGGRRLPERTAAGSRLDMGSPVSERSALPPHGGAGRSYNEQQLPPSTGPSSHQQRAPRQLQHQQGGDDDRAVPSMPPLPRAPPSAGPFGPAHYHVAPSWQTPAGGGSGFITPAAAAAAGAGAGSIAGLQQMHPAVGGVGLSFETPAALAGPRGPPAPPQKAAAAAGHPEGTYWCRVVRMAIQIS